MTLVQPIIRTKLDEYSTVRIIEVVLYLVRYQIQNTNIRLRTEY